MTADLFDRWFAREYPPGRVDEMVCPELYHALRRAFTPDSVTSLSGGTCYLLCFAKRYEHAVQHHADPGRFAIRMQEHRSGNGARLMEVITDAGIDFEIARLWIGSQHRERQLKQHGATRHGQPRSRTPGDRPQRNRVHIA